MSDELTIGKPYVFRTPSREEMRALGFEGATANDGARDCQEVIAPYDRGGDGSVESVEASESSMADPMDSTTSAGV